jgi:hypothetical protein
MNVDTLKVGTAVRVKNSEDVGTVRCVDRMSGDVRIALSGDYRDDEWVGVDQLAPVYDEQRELLSDG